MLNLTLYTWHSGALRFDEVTEIVEVLSIDEARCLAMQKMHSDHGATRVQVASSGRLLVDLARDGASLFVGSRDRV